MKVIKVSDALHAELMERRGERSMGEFIKVLIDESYTPQKKEKADIDVFIEEVGRVSEKQVAAIGKMIEQAIARGNVQFQSTPPHKNNLEATPQRKRAGVPQDSGKLLCCKGKTPCRHWVWDVNSGDGYVHSITGEKREV